MIKFENTEVMNFENAIRGMRNPMNSWDKSDSRLEIVNKDDYELGYEANYEYIIGENDLSLMKKLIKAGSEHRKFLRQIFVSVDITAPLYWWKEFDTYKVGTVANSCSTMHKIHAKEFEIEDFSTEHLVDFSWNRLNDLIIHMNICREIYLETKDKEYWWQLIQLLPTSYNQKRTVTLNYEVLYSIYRQRKNHKLDEWRIDFMEWIEELPYAKELILNER